MDSDSSSDDEPVAQNQQFLSLKSRLNQQNSPNKYNNTMNEELAAAGGDTYELNLLLAFLLINFAQQVELCVWIPRNTQVM